MKMSECCEVEDEKATNYINAGPMWSELGKCPACGEDCEWREVEEKPIRYEWEYVGCNWHKVPVYAG